jgi:hypothetical protein
MFKKETLELLKKDFIELTNLQLSKKHKRSVVCIRKALKENLTKEEYENLKNQRKSKVGRKFIPFIFIEKEN